MMPRFLVMALCLAAATCAFSQQIDNGLVQVSAVGEPGAFTGFAVTAGEAEVATISFGSNSAITARVVRAVGDSLRFSGLSCAPTPTLGPDSFVEVRLLPDDRYPEVTFHLNLTRFDQDAWEERFGEVPFHFLVCSIPGAEIFHQRGWPIGTPVVDEYIMDLAEGFGRQVVSNWSRDWMYAPPIGAYPTAIAGLWNPSKRFYVGYDFHHARLTDHSEKDFGTSYCRRCGESEQFFCLTWPFGKRYIDLRYPETPVECGTHFRLLWSLDMGPDDDPNRFVNEFIWRAYADLLPGVERMNDLSWLTRPYRISGFNPPGPLGDFVGNSGEKPRWWAPNVHLIGGVGYFSPIDYYYDVGDEQSIAKLGSQSRRIIELGKWMDIEGDRCYFWQTPLDGGGAEDFGPGVETFHHVRGWSAGLALLDYCRNDPAGAADILPFVDGVLRYTKHILYTRNCYPDVPAAQFAWSATPCVTFCLKYYYHFRDDPEREDLAELAYKLARNMTYRYLAIWPCDNDEMDDLDSSFMMEPNAGLPWLGCACANEIWVYNIAMLYEYVATGDPIMGHYLRGMLERYHEMFHDQWYATVADYGHAFTERLGLFDECAQGKGGRADFGGLWGGFERLIWPVGSATARVVCGEKAAMCFNRDGRHTDIAGYRYYGDGSFSFELVPGGLQADADRERDIAVTFPFFDLRDKRVAIRRGGERIALAGDRIISYEPEPSTLTLKRVKLGDTICVGKYDETTPALPCSIAKPRKSPSPDGPSHIERNGFAMLNLARGAFEGISRDWDDTGSLAGYESGIKTIYGVPFLLLDPDLTGNNVCVPRRGIAFGEDPEYLFLLVGDIEERSRLTLHRDFRTKERVDLAGAIPAIKGWPPVLQWRIDLVMIENKGRPIMSIAPTGCKIFAITATDKSPAQLAGTLAAVADRRGEIIAHNEAVRALAELAPLFEPFSGHIGVLPAPLVKNPQANAVVKMLHEAGLAKHLVFISKRDLINPRAFNTRDIWIALYLGGEDYWQTVGTEGDGDAALLGWLKGGGTLVSLGNGPFPFYYDQGGKPVVGAPKFGLPISGSGANERLDTLDVAPIHGWEEPPEGLALTFHVNPNQDIITNLPATIPWMAEADQRWRPIFDVVDERDSYTPIVTLKDQAGRKYGEAAAMIDYKTGELSGARVVYIWHSLRRSREYRTAILAGLFRYLLTNTLRPIGEYTCIRAAEAPVIDGKLDDAIWRQAAPTDAFIRLDGHRGDGMTLRTTAKMAWDDGALYIAWECEDPDIWSTITERDGNLWEGEVVEAYIDPDGDGKQYKELEISPLNVVVDLNIPEAIDGAPQDVNGARKWNATNWTTGVQMRGTLDNREDTDVGWTTETAIPWRNFTSTPKLPPHIGDMWRFQLFRIDRSNKLEHPQFSSWSQTDTFHNPSRFGRLIFGANPYDEDFFGYEAGAAPTGIWAAASGEWKVIGGELVGKNSGTDRWLPSGLVGGHADWTDYRLSLRFQIREHGGDHRDGAWIGFRYANEGQCYSLNFHSDIRLNKAHRGIAAGDTTSLARAKWPNDSKWHTAVITVRGARITVALDGEDIIDVRDENSLGVPPVPAGGICLSARQWTGSKGDTIVAFDDVKVEEL